MSDPAIEAAQRAWHAEDDGPHDGFVRAGRLVVAAREALKPIRELHVPVIHADEHTSERWAECRECLGAYWPCETAKLIYTSEELAR